MTPAIAIWGEVVRNPNKHLSGGAKPDKDQLSGNHPTMHQPPNRNGMGGCKTIKKATDTNLSEPLCCS